MGKNPPFSEKPQFRSLYTVSMVIVIDCFKLQVSMWLVNLSYNCNCDWLIELPANNLPSELEENNSIFQTNHNRGNFIFMIK